MNANVLLCAAAVVIVTLLFIVNKVTKPNNGGRKSKSKRLFRGKHQFIHRSSLMDSTMSLFVSWRADSSGSNIFRGWYNCCWIAGCYWLLQYVINNWIENGSLVGDVDWFWSLGHSLHELVIALLPIYAISFSAFFLQKLLSQQIFGKKYSRTILHSIQHSLQTIMIFGAAVFVYCFTEHWPITQRFAVIAEALVLYMKMHSYMLSNQELYQLKYASNKKIDTNDGDDVDILQIADDVDKIDDEQVKQQLAQRGLKDFGSINIHNITPSNFYYHGDDTQGKLHSEITKLKEMKASELEKYYMRMILKDSIFFENYRKQIYPQNVTIFNWIQFTFFPTLVYEPLYPRSSSIRILYVLEKLCVIFAIMSFMFAILERYIIKQLIEHANPKPFMTLINMVPLILLLTLSFFFVVFEGMLNAVAELTCFGDREFYQDWWNSSTFAEFSRKWNRPVHEFLLRHIFFDLMKRYKLSNAMALIATFLFSIALHELILCVCFHHFSPWFAFFSILQFPLIAATRSPTFKGKPLGNIVFWTFIMLGLSMVCVVYARVYCSNYDCSMT